MRKSLSLWMLISLACTVAAQTDGQEGMIRKIDESLASMKDEELEIAEQIAMLEEQSKVQNEHMDLLRARLASLDGQLENSRGSTGAGLDNPGTSRDALAGLDDQKIRRLEDEMISTCAERMVVLKGRDEQFQTAFLGPQDGKTRIFASAPWIAENLRFEVFDLNGNAIPIGKDFTCPAGIELLGLIPESADMPHFEVIAEEEIPAVGDRILIVAVDGKSKGLSGIGGNIRGIGPDNMEIDANLTAEMSGAPVLSLRDGKVIGIVAHQLSGITNDWALGTRHEAGRNFVLRLDHMKEWQSGDLARFAKEEAYVRRITARTRVASAAQLMLECEVWLAVNRRPPYLSASRPAPGEDQTEFFKRRREESDSLAGRVKDWQLQRQRMQTLNKEALEQAAELESDPLIRKAQAWIKELGAAGKLEPGGDLDQKLTGIYRHILVDLKKKEPDLSAHLNQYHKEQYRLAVEDREEGIHTIEARINRVSR